MSTRERIIIIRLLEKASGHPLFAALLGIGYPPNAIDSDAKD